jgi:hypothetical protein
LPVARCGIHTSDSRRLLSQQAGRRMSSLVSRGPRSRQELRCAAKDIAKGKACCITPAARP